MECVLPEDVLVQSKCVKALDHLNIDTCELLVSEQHYSSQGGIVLQDKSARVHLGYLCFNYNLALLDCFTKCCTKESVWGHVG